MMDDDIQAVDSPLTGSPAMMLPSDVMSPFSGAAGSPVSSLQRQLPQQPGSTGLTGIPGPPGQSKYAQLLSVIEEMGKDIRPTYAGSKSSAERLKRGIVHARILVRECLMETERSARQ